MKLSELLKSKFNFTTKTSDNNRKLAFAGIAIIWIFKKENNTLSADLIIPFILFAISLLLDILQYYSHSIVLHYFYHKREKKFIKSVELDPEVTLPDNVNWFNYSMFYLKIPFTILSYILLINYLYSIIIIK